MSSVICGSKVGALQGRTRYRPAAAGAARRKSVAARTLTLARRVVADSPPASIARLKTPVVPRRNENALTELAAEASLHPISRFAVRGAGARDRRSVSHSPKSDALQLPTPDPPARYHHRSAFWRAEPLDEARCPTPIPARAIDC